MTILVTGAGGNVGSALLSELASAGIQPRAAFHSTEKTQRARDAGLDAVTIDFGAPATLGPALAGVDTVFLLGSGGRGQAEGEKNVVAAAKSAGARRIVKLSVIGAPDEGFAFARIHRPVERAIEASGLAWTLLRPNGFMQNFSNFMAPTIATQRSIFTTIADARIAHVDVRDIARVAAAALTEPGHDGKAYTLTGPYAFSYRDAASTISAIIGTKIACVPISEGKARAGMKAGGIPDFYAEYLLDLERYYRDGEGDVVTTTIQDVTGEEPTSFEEFVRDFSELFGG